jgi:hypothetical protein
MQVLANACDQGCQIFLGTTVKNMTMKYTKWHKTMYQIAIQYTNIFHCKTLKNLPELRFLVGKYINHLATLTQPRSIDVYTYPHYERVLDFFIKSHTLYLNGFRSHDSYLAPVSLVAGGDDTTRPRHRQGNIIRLFFTTLGVK